jgi:hypothetical protein
MTEIELSEILSVCSIVVTIFNCFFIYILDKKIEQLNMLQMSIKFERNQNVEKRD